MRSLLWIAFIALVSSIALMPLVAERLRRWGLTSRNFRDQRVLTGAGVALVLAVGVSYVLCDVFDLEGFDARAAWRHFLIVALFCGIGLVDDILGDRSVVGITAHFRKLAEERRITAGVFKAAAGVGLSLVVGLNLAEGEIWPGFVNGLLLAITANLVNQFDVRPARALKLYWAVTLVGVLLATNEMRLAVVPLILATLIIYRADAEGRVMLGDAGALALGGSCGLLLIDGIQSVALKFVLALLLLGLGVLMEFRSLGGVIQSNPILAYLDHLGVPSQECEDSSPGA